MTRHKAGIIAIWVAAIIAATLLIYYYYTADPAKSISAPKCVFKLLTGWDCPGCGSQRALHALLHGHIAQAWNFNPFIFFAVPVAIFYAIIETGRTRWPKLHAKAIHPAILIPIALAITAWWILRNIL